MDVITVSKKMNIKDKIWLINNMKYSSLFISMLLIWSITFSVFYGVISFDINRKTDQEMEEYSLSLIGKLEVLLKSGENTLDEINSLSLSTCSSDTIDKLKLLNFNYSLIKNIRWLDKDNNEICSSMYGKRENILEGVKPYILITRTSYWFNKIVDKKNNESYHLVMKKGTARINMYLKIIFDSNLEVKPYLKAQIFSKDRVVSSAKSTNMTPLSLLNEDEWKIKKTMSSVESFSIIVARNKGNINLTILESFIDYLKVMSLVSILLCFFLYCFVKKRQKSFKLKMVEGFKKDEFIPYFQPIIDAKTRKCVGAEVLTRWIRSDGEFISPMEFIPAAERYGLITTLTQRIIVKALKDVGLFLAQHPEHYISINLSLDDLNDDSVYNLLIKEIKYYKLSSRQIRIELTERQFIDKECSISALHRYREAGFKIYVDDFGTGYSSLAYLKDLPLDTLKIDKVFVDSLGDKSGSVTKHIIDMAKTLNLDLVAEGVETEQQSQHLQALGVNIMQGWLYSKALPAVDWILFCHIESHSHRKENKQNKPSLGSILNVREVPIMP